MSANVIETQKPIPGLELDKLERGFVEKGLGSIALSNEESIRDWFNNLTGDQQLPFGD